MSKMIKRVVAVAEYPVLDGVYPIDTPNIYIQIIDQNDKKYRFDTDCVQEAIVKFFGLTELETKVKRKSVYWDGHNYG